MFGKKKKEKKKSEGFVFQAVEHKEFDPTRTWDSFPKEKKTKLKIFAIIGFVVLVLICAYMVCLSDEFHDYFKELAKTRSTRVAAFLTASVPAFIETIILIANFFNLFMLLKFVHCHIRFKSQKSKTLVGLTFSILNYGVFLSTLLIILNSWGVDTYGLLASAGVFTLIIGFGAETIVADLISGIFIAIEGYVAVGDIVSIDNFVGTIREIGLRVTIIENLNHQQQIVRNSEINSIINTSKTQSFTKVTFAVQHKNPSELIDRLVNENIEIIKKSNPDITSVTYLGLVDVSHYAATYCIAFTSLKKRELQCHNSIIQTVYRIFEENGVVR